MFDARNGRPEIIPRQFRTMSVMEAEKVYVDRDNLLELCRLAYMLILELEDTDEYYDLIDEMVREVLLAKSGET